MSLTLLPPPHSHPSQAEASRCNGSTQNATQGQASTPVATSNNGPGSSTPTRSSSAANISSAVSSSVGRRETPRAPTRRASLPALTPSLSGRLPSAQGAPAPETASDERSLSGAAGLRTGTCSAVTPESLRTMQGPPSLGTTPSSRDTHQAPCSADAAHPGSTVQDHMPHPHGLSPCGHTTTTASVQENATLLPPQPNSVSAHLHLHPPGTGVLSGELSSAAPMQAASQAQPTHTSSVGFPPVSSPDIYVSEVGGETVASAVTHTVIGPMDALCTMSEVLSTQREGRGAADPAFDAAKRWNSLSILPRPTTEPSGTSGTHSGGSQPAVKAHTLAMHRSLPSFPSS